MKNQNITFITTLLALGFLALSPIAQAVVPAPDGGYPGGNTAEGTNALLGRTTGVYNTAVGIYSLLSLTSGQFCTGVGAGTLFLNTADRNTATGTGALLSNTVGTENTAAGAFALFSNTSGIDNTANGASTLLSNTTGESNTANGTLALLFNTAGSSNTANGAGALESNTSGSNNTALGSGAGENLTTGDNNIDIGYNVLGAAGESNTIRLGNTDITTTIIRGISGTTIASGATVLVAANGQLGTMTSSARFKDELKPMDTASEALFSLKPVTFRYKKKIDPQRIAQFGLVAEQVEKVNPDLVVRDQQGKPYSVRYDQVNAMLLNEFLKEHKAFVEEHRKVQELEKGMAALTATVKEQSAQIQKVSDRVELNTPAVQTVASDQ